MTKIRTTKTHSKNGPGLWQKGDEYDETPTTAREKVERGLAEYVEGEEVRTKEDPEMYRSRAKGDGPQVEYKSGQWYFFTDGEKVLGKRAAADYLGISVADLGELEIEDRTGDSDSD